MAEQEKCRQCGKELSDDNRVVNYCRDCWCARIRLQQEFFEPYEEKLRVILEKKGIRTVPGTLSGLDETGRPLEAVRKTGAPMLPLRDSEHAVRLFRARDALLALPNSGSALRYILPSADGNFMKQLGSLGEGFDEYGSRCNAFLAAVSDGTHVYALSDNGRIYHTNPSVAGPIPISSRLALHREVWHTFFSEEQIRESAAWVNSYRGSTVNVDGGSDYYDPSQRMFFSVVTDGDFYHGYDVSYIRLKKADVINKMLYLHGLFDSWEKCRRGEIPLAAKLDLAEEAPADTAYSAEEGFGYGIHFM